MKKNIFSAYRKPNIGLEARNGEGGKKPKANSGGKKFLLNKLSFHSLDPRCRACRENSDECSTLRPQAQILQRPWDQGVQAPSQKKCQYLVGHSTPKVIKVALKPFGSGEEE